MSTNLASVSAAPVPSTHDHSASFADKAEAVVPVPVTGGPPDPGRGRSGFVGRHGTKLLVSLIVAGLFVWILGRGGLPLLPPTTALQKMRLDLIPLHVALYVGMHFFRAYRWRYLLRPLDPQVPTRRVLGASWIGFAAIMVFPLRAGEIVRPWLVRDGKKIGLSGALGTVGAERVFDGLMVTLLLAVALLAVPHLDPLPPKFGDLDIPVAAIPAAGFAALALFVAAFTAMAVFYVARAFALEVVKVTVGRLSQSLADKVAHVVEGLAAGLHFLADRRQAVPFIWESILYWGMNAAGSWVLGVACGLPMNFGHACAVMGVLAVGVLVPAGPGLFGAFQAATYGGLAMYFPQNTIVHEGAVYVFMLYASQFALHLLGAAVGWALDPSMMNGPARSLDAEGAALPASAKDSEAL